MNVDKYIKLKQFFEDLESTFTNRVEDLKGYEEFDSDFIYIINDLSDEEYNKIFNWFILDIKEVGTKEIINKVLEQYEQQETTTI